MSTPQSCEYGNELIRANISTLSHTLILFTAGSIESKVLCVQPRDQGKYRR